MSKFNTPVRVRPDTTNFEGSEAYDLDPKAKLVTILLSSFLKDQFYRKGSDTLDELVRQIEVVAEGDPLFVAKAAIYARDEFGMRSVSHVAAAELCRYVKGEQWLKNFLRRVVVRPDDVTEILSYWKRNKGEPIPNAMKKGLGLAMSDMSEYSLGKYQAKNKAISMVDAVNLCHPKHTEPLGKLIEGTLESPDTWEVRLTQAGSDPVAKALVWYVLLSEKKLGYFALLRNIKNICEQSPNSIGMLCEQLVNEQAIRKSRVLPFRYMTAWKTISTNSSVSANVLAALSDAMDLSVGNMPSLSGRTLVALDGSGSMTWSGTPPAIEIASIFAAAISKSNEAEVLIFDTEVQWYRANPRAPMISITEQLRAKTCGGGTNFHLIFGHDKPFDRIVILSDMQAWVGGHTPDSTYKEWKRRTGSDPYVYCLDVAGYGSSQFPGNKVMQLSGWSEKILDLMVIYEKGFDSLTKSIESVEIQ